MIYLFHLGHPAHFHLFKNVINSLQRDKHEVHILIKNKDVLEELIKNYGFEYTNILPTRRKNSLLGIIYSQIVQDIRLLEYSIKHKPDLLIGTSVSISHVGKMLGIPVLNVNEDDLEIVPLYAKLSYPWASQIIIPKCCTVGKWYGKKIGYDGYHELAYLHPNNFIPNKEIVNKYFSADTSFFIIRFAKLSAHHDTGIKGISSQLAREIIDTLSPHGKVFITSERPLEPEFEQYRIVIDPVDIHHFMAYAQLYIGDSQTMAVEAGILGTPFIRVNDFVGRISILKELEDKYGLGYGIKPNKNDAVISQIKELLNLKDRKSIFQKRRDKMLSEKIDYSMFLTWFIEEYPKSAVEMKINPDIQYRFR